MCKFVELHFLLKKSFVFAMVGIQGSDRGWECVLLNSASNSFEYLEEYSRWHKMYLHMKQ